jgi:hypothetical protein
MRSNETESWQRTYLRMKGFAMILLGVLFPLLGIYILVVSDRSGGDVAAAMLFLLIGVIGLCGARVYLRIVHQHPDYGK